MSPDAARGRQPSKVGFFKKNYMPIIPWRRFEELDRFFGEDFPSSLFREIETIPRANIYETNGEIIAEMSVPGVKPEDIEVTVSNDILRIRGESEETKEEEERGYWRKEIQSGSFERAFHLPSSIIESSVEAETKNGLLRIRMPKLKGSKSESHKIKVKGE